MIIVFIVIIFQFKQISFSIKVVTSCCSIMVFNYVVIYRIVVMLVTKIRIDLFTKRPKVFSKEFYTYLDNFVGKSEF